MNNNFINEINKKRKKYLLNALWGSIFVIIGMCLIQVIQLKTSAYKELTFICVNLFVTLPIVIGVFVTCSKIFSHNVSLMTIYAIADQLKGFKKIPLTNLENREYDSYLPSEIDWAKLPVPPEKVLFSTILQRFDIHHIELRTMFSGINNSQQPVNLSELTVFKDFHFGQPEKVFNALILTVKTDKNLNSITYFQTHFDYLKEEFDAKLTKINLAKNIDTYTDNTDIARKLATPELMQLLTKLKKQFKVECAKVVFHNEYIVFVLRSLEEEGYMHNYFPVNISLLTPFDITKAGKAVENFQTIYDLANKAPDFTKNV